MNGITPTRDGYTFVEWNTKADGSGTRFSNGMYYTSDKTYYAIWE